MNDSGEGSAIGRIAASTRTSSSWSGNPGEPARLAVRTHAHAGVNKIPRLRYSALMHRATPLFALTILLACNSPKGGSETAPGAATKPGIDLVVRSVAIQKTIKKGAVAGEEDERWDALDGKVYAIVTADIGLNSCTDGDKIDSRKASLLLDGGQPAATEGGGPNPEKLCVLCQPSESAGCRGGQAPLHRFTFVFSVPEKSDIGKAQLRYQDRDAPLSVADITDKRGNDELDKQIEEKEAKLKAMKKRLENTGSKADGEILIGEMDALKKESDTLKKKRR